MKNTVWKVIKAWKNTFDRRDAKVNFSIPQNLISYYGINGKKNDKHLVLSEDNFRLQIGKMEKNNETIYTKDILLPALEYIIKKTPENKKAIIQLWPDLAKYLINKDQEEKWSQILTFDEEKKEIEKMIKKYFKKDSSKLKIINVTDQYPEVFSLLSEKWKDGLATSQKPTLSKDWFSALSLVQYLYWHAQKNPALMQLFYATKPTEQREQDVLPAWQNQSDYYSLVEIWIRLYEILTGISIQWGIDRQSKYDKIIWGILQRKDVDKFKTKNYPELKELHDFCGEINPDFVFDRLWIDTKEVKEVTKKKESLSKFKKTTLITSLLLAWVLTGAVGGYQFSQYKQKKKLQKDLQEKIQKYDIASRVESGKNWKISSLEEKENYLRGVVAIFMSVYWSWDFDEDDLLYKMVDNFDDDSFNEYSDKYELQKMNFINQKFIPKNDLSLKNAWISLQPYENLSKYEDAFINSWLDTLWISIKETRIDFLAWWLIDPVEVDKIWDYTTLGGTVYEIWYITRYEWSSLVVAPNGTTIPGTKNKKYLVAKVKNSRELGFSNKYSVENAKYLCEDYFMRTRPQFQFFYDLIRKSCQNTKWAYSDIQLWQIKEIILEYMIKNRVWKDDVLKYKEGFYPKDWMDAFYNDFLSKSANDLKSIWINPEPYSAFDKYVDAFENTERYWNMSREKRWDDDFLVPTYKELSKYDWKIIGEYIDQNGNAYWVSCITVGNKRYILASERNWVISNSEPCIYNWKQVRDDFKVNWLRK